MNKQILRLAIPNIITTITVPLLGMVDVAIVGHLGNEQYLGAIALGTMIFNLIYWNFGFLRMGTSGFTAQAYGAVNKEEIMHIFGRAMSIALAVSLLLVIFQYPIKTLVLQLVQGSQEVEYYAAVYFDICIWGAPAILGLYVIKGWFIGMQNAKTPMWIAIQINVVNIIFSLLFVFGFGMKIEGVALGSLISQYLGLITAMALWFAYYRQYTPYFSLKKILAFDKMKAFFKVNADIFLRTLCLIAVFTFIPAEGAKMGDRILAINILLMQFFTLFSYIMDGFAYAGESLTGKYVGARNKTSLRLSINYLFRWGAALTAFFILLYAFFGKYLLALFTDNIAIIEDAHDYYYWVLLVPVAGFAAFLWDGILIGATKVKIMRNASFIATFAFFVMFYLLENLIGNHALWLAFVLFLLFRSLLQSIWGPKAIFKNLQT
ncbi:MAG: MATE family efflux transporter [Bacteroidales bacterium]|nr:MATE family efflux transporter [Bacteroidales bacterium]